MKALTISQPFASLIANGEKWIENRTWDTVYRGPLVIHAGKGTQYLTKAELAKYPTGCCIAVARLVACVKLSLVESRNSQGDAGTMLLALKPWVRFGGLGVMSRLTCRDVLNHKHAEGPYLWILGDVERLAEPIPYKGERALFEIPDDVLPLSVRMR